MLEGPEYWLQRLLVVGVAGQGPGRLLDVLLGVALTLAHAEQLHYFAGQVLVGLALDVAVVVQIAEHGRVVDDAVKQSGKVAGSVLPEQLVLPKDGVAVLHDALLGGEVAMPEQG